MPRRFFGFGFGPIQAGLMLSEAIRSGGFDGYAFCDTDRRLVDAVRANGGTVRVNVAGPDGVRVETLSGIEVYNPSTAADGEEIGRAIRGADEMATAVPSVAFYGAGSGASIAAFLAANVSPEKPRILYAAENDNFAAEILMSEILARAPAERLARLQILNTVIGKMSGSITSTAERESLGLAPLVPGFDRCVLVEEFNRILISRVSLPGFRRAIRVFEEKDDLLPFEEAKLYGHNAVHALLGYLAWTRGYDAMSEIRGDPELLALGRKAFVEESGAALIRKHASTRDPLFTEEGYRAYAEDLLARMTNPHLHDRVERVIRDPQRKLGYSDRLIGTMREALKQGVKPVIMAIGAAAATLYAVRLKGPANIDPHGFLLSLWREDPADEWRETIVAMIEEALTGLADTNAAP